MEHKHQQYLFAMFGGLHHFFLGAIAVFNTAPFVMVGGFDKHDYDVMKPPINRNRNILDSSSPINEGPMTIAIGVVNFSAVFMAVFLMILRNEAAAKRHFLGYHHW
jgi:magnesium-transporting ATPase (P-type)